MSWISNRCPIGVETDHLTEPQESDRLVFLEESVVRMHAQGTVTLEQAICRAFLERVGHPGRITAVSRGMTRPRYYVRFQ